MFGTAAMAVAGAVVSGYRFNSRSSHLNLFWNNSRKTSAPLITYTPTPVAFMYSSSMITYKRCIKSKYADRAILTRIIPLALFDCKIATRATFQHLFGVWQYNLQSILDLGHLSRFSNSPKIVFLFLKTANVKCQI